MATTKQHLQRQPDTVTVRAHAPVNDSGWQYRCPDGHAHLTWSSSTLVRCQSCGQGYPPSEIRDVKRDRMLEEAMNDGTS